ncbi:MAG TPA: hypothetical protein VE869_07385 [Gemmatimonas sp.]|nr:hypothetical protein [Gemmatimonas sp.]
MRISAWTSSRRDGWIHLSARLQWEETERTETLWFEWPESNAAFVRPTADSALLLAYPLAMSYGERRLVVDGEVSPRLAEGARAVMAVIASAGPTLRAVRLELHEGFGDFESEAPSRAAGLCLSGGVDALSALQDRVHGLPRDHAARFRCGLFAFGFNTYDFVNGAPDPARLTAAEAYADRLDSLAAELGVTLTRVRTNYRTLHRSFDAWGMVANDSHLAAIGHLMRPRLRSLAIGSLGTGITAGTSQNPLLVAFHSTDDLDVHTAHPMRSRLEKLRVLLTWPEALAVLRVCFLIRTPGGGARNCGECEKCVRTVLQCIALGAADAAPVRAAFTVWPDTPEAIARLDVGSSFVRPYYEELEPLLRSRGRVDLATAISRGLVGGRR